MALPIASIPVLTGEEAQRFEERAQSNYHRYLNRTEEHVNWSAKSDVLSKIPVTEAAY